MFTLPDAFYAMVFSALTFLKRFESYIYDLSRVMDMYVELESIP
jgi:hypothetical protein